MENILTQIILYELRNWFLLILAIIGGVITIKTYRSSVRQHKLENTYKTIDFLRRHITDRQIETYVTLFHANNPLGFPENEFHFKDGRIDTIETMFAEGGSGKGDIHNMVEVFNLVSKKLNKGILNEDLIWYEYGDIMLTCYKWTKYLDKNLVNIFIPKRREGMSDKDYKKIVDFFKSQMKGTEKLYIDFHKYIEKHNKNKLDLPIKHYTYFE